eukprot:5595721-Amphidinium_carterae.2
MVEGGRAVEAARHGRGAGVTKCMTRAQLDIALILDPTTVVIVTIVASPQQQSHPRFVNTAS